VAEQEVEVWFHRVQWSSSSLTRAGLRCA
jgi:hypothetical protein